MEAQRQGFCQAQSRPYCSACDKALSHGSRPPALFRASSSSLRRCSLTRSGLPMVAGCLAITACPARSRGRGSSSPFGPAPPADVGGKRAGAWMCQGSRSCAPISPVKIRPSRTDFHMSGCKAALQVPRFRLLRAPFSGCIMLCPHKAKCLRVAYKCSNSNIWKPRVASAHVGDSPLWLLGGQGGKQPTTSSLVDSGAEQLNSGTEPA